MLRRVRVRVRLPANLRVLRDVGCDGSQIASCHERFRQEHDRGGAPRCETAGPFAMGLVAAAGGLWGRSVTTHRLCETQRRVAAAPVQRQAICSTRAFAHSG